jgi:hypothetical protein
MNTSPADPRPTPALSLRALAVYGPLLLFTSGILGWVDGLAGQPGGGALRVGAQAFFGAGLLALAAVAVVLVRDRPPMAIGSWLLVVGGVGVIAVTRELLPPAALLVLIGLAPLVAGDAGMAGPVPAAAHAVPAVPAEPAVPAVPAEAAGAAVLDRDS